MSCDKSHPSLKNPIGWLRAVSKISSRTFFIVTHTCHRPVYLLWIILICAVVWRLIYFNWSVRTSFRIFLVPVKFLIQSVWFERFAMKWSSDPHREHIFGFWPLYLMRLLLELLEMKCDFICTLSFLCCLKTFSKFSFYVSYWIFQIQVINFKVRYR